MGRRWPAPLVLLCEARGHVDAFAHQIAVALLDGVAQVPWDATNIATLAHCDAVRRGHPLHHCDVGRGRRRRNSRANRGPNFKTHRRTVS
jgi:hypothetical protein